MKVQVENAQQNEQVDWSKNPQLVVNSNGDIVFVSKYQNTTDEETFIGEIINQKENDKRGVFNNKWLKDYFKPFHGKITLQND